MGAIVAGKVGGKAGRKGRSVCGGAPRPHGQEGLRNKACLWRKCPRNLPQGQSHVDFAALTARLKSCPDTGPELRRGFLESFGHLFENRLGGFGGVGSLGDGAAYDEVTGAL